MKRKISIVTAVAALLSCCNMTAFAETSPKPANVDEAVYTRLMEEKHLYDEEAIRKNMRKFTEACKCKRSCLYTAFRT